MSPDGSVSLARATTSFSSFRNYSHPSPSVGFRSRADFRLWLALCVRSTEEDAPPINVINAVDGDLFPALPPAFTYMHHVVHGLGVPRTPRALLTGCACVGVCGASTLCDCIRRQRAFMRGVSRGFMYRDGLLISSGFPVFECNSN